MIGDWTNPYLPRITRTTHALLAEAASLWPSLDAVRENGKTLTYAQLNENTLAIGDRLRAKGIGQGDVLALDLPVGVDLLQAFLGVTRLGAAALPLHTLLSPADVKALLDASDPRACLGSHHHATRLEVWSPGDLAAIGNSSRDCPAPREDDPALLRTTSGSTGYPKLIKLSHLQICRRIAHPGSHYRRGEVYGCPSRYAFPAYQLLSALCVGATVVFRHAVTAMQVEKFIAEEDLTCFWGIPSLYTQIARLGGSYAGGLGRLRAAVTSGAVLAQELRMAVEQRWGVPVYQMYGQSETGYLTEADQATPANSVGLPAPGVELRIAGGEGNILPRGETGVIQARTEAPFNGYLTGEASPLTDDGWFITGDLGYMDAQGFLYLQGRADDMIQVGGFKVSAAEISAVLQGMPGLREVYIFALPHDLRGEAVAAAVVAEDGIRPIDVRRYARRFLPRRKQPVEVYIVNELPKSPLGKVQKQRLLEDLSRDSPPTSPP